MKTKKLLVGSKKDIAQYIRKGGLAVVTLPSSKSIEQQLENIEKNGICGMGVVFYMLCCCNGKPMLMRQFVKSKSTGIMGNIKSVYVKVVEKQRRTL